MYLSVDGLSFSVSVFFRLDDDLPPASVVVVLLAFFSAFILAEGCFLVSLCWTNWRTTTWSLESVSVGFWGSDRRAWGIRRATNRRPWNGRPRGAPTLCTTSWIWAVIYCIYKKSYSLVHINASKLKKGNQAPIQKFEICNRKIPKSKSFSTSVKNWCPQLTWTLNEAISPKIWIESKQIRINENQWRFFIVLHLKSIPLL